MVDVSVVILSYNASKLLRDCIDSVLKFTKDIAFELIVVDNASTDDSAQVAKSYGDKIKFIQSSENGGFAKGNNLGIKVAKGRYALLLNNDTVFVENSLARMKLWMDAHADVAVASCQLVDSEQKITPTGGYFPTLRRVLPWAFFLDDLPFVSKIFHSYHPHVSDAHWESFGKDLPLVSRLARKGDTGAKGEIYNYAEDFFPDWVTGAFFMVRKEVMDKVGLLDENIFMYGEELEWCMRFRSAGWKIGYTAITKIVHLERKSSGEAGSRNAILGEFRGLKYIYGKYYPSWKQIALGSILDLAAFFRIIFWLLRRKPQMAKIYLEALVM